MAPTERSTLRPALAAHSGSVHNGMRRREYGLTALPPFPHPTAVSLTPCKRGGLAFEERYRSPLPSCNEHKGGVGKGRQVLKVAAVE
jgi:hypothetical protein